MFKSSFSKYMAALAIIIFVSFLMLSGIITAIIRNHVTYEKINKLEMSTTILKGHFESEAVERLDTYINSDLGASVIALFPLVNSDYNLEIIITDVDGRLIMSTMTEENDTDFDYPTLDIGIFEEQVGRNGETFLQYTGRVDGIIDEAYIIYGSPVVTGGETRGYVFTLAAYEVEEALIGVAKKAVINASVWVMLAALVAAYFIIDRIVHPLKTMTDAVKRFAKGNFSERITVTGSKEVAELSVAFNNMAESLENLEKMRSTFLASISHDLRTPMTTIAGYIDGINSGAIPPEKQGYYLDIISGEIHRLSRLVSQLLDVSRLESGDRKFEFADFDIAEVARQVIITFESKLNDKHLDVEFISDDDYMPVYGDQDAIYQVIYNLCHNAIKFADTEGRFIIKISRTAERKVRLSVYDDGQRMTDEESSRVFERFFKSDESRGLDKDGVGLGLYISKSIIMAHDEEIGVQVHENGCEFWFTLKEGEPQHKHTRI